VASGGGVIGAANEGKRPRSTDTPYGKKLSAQRLKPGSGPGDAVADYAKKAVRVAKNLVGEGEREDLFGK
jgi:hypothetical protein